MNKKVLAVSLLLAMILVAGALIAGISPDSATKDKSVTFTYRGEGTVWQWCVQEPESRSWTRCEETSSSTFAHKFSKAGTGKVRVRADVDSGEIVETIDVTVSE